MRLLAHQVYLSVQKVCFLSLKERNGKMEMVLVFVLFALGLILIIKGGDFFVDAASFIAEVSGIPKFIIGATVVSLATTMPEMLVSVFAALEGNAEIAVGNAVGSVTANTGLIMCLSLVLLPCMMDRKQFGIKAGLLLLSVSTLMFFTRDGNLSVIESCAILVIFALFIVENLISGRQQQKLEKQNKPTNTEKVDKKTLLINILKFVVGAAGIVIGAQLLIDNGEKIAKMLGIPDAIVAATMIAIGTSLPELITTITAIKKKQSSLSVGNIIGANIMDLTLIMPLCALIQGKPLLVENQGLALDIPACFVVTVLAMLPALFMGKFKKWQGYLIGSAYVAYLAIMFIYFG